MQARVKPTPGEPGRQQVETAQTLFSRPCPAPPRRRCLQPEHLVTLRTQRWVVIDSALPTTSVRRAREDVARLQLEGASPNGENGAPLRPLLFIM